QALPNMKITATKTKPVLETADLTPIRRDFAFVLDESVAASDVIRVAEKTDKTLITGVSVFDVYQGANIGEGKKSIAVEVTIQPRGEAMTDADIDALSQKIIAGVEKATGGTLRA
ncbi:MAG: phenylalanine--tRNA ligase subunit beta, partial [Pseudomonadota bacterium]